MQVKVTFKNIDSSDALREHAVDKSQCFSKYVSGSTEVHWFLSVEKIRHQADATIVADGIKIQAHEVSDDMYSAIDMASDKLEKQLRRHKDKVKDHHKSSHGAVPEMPYVESAEDAPEAAGEKGSPKVVETANYFIKPMSTEEAGMQMDISGDDFLVFTNASTNGVNVLYRRSDGDYGLIETTR